MVRLAVALLVLGAISAVPVSATAERWRTVVLPPESVNLAPQQSSRYAQLLLVKLQARPSIDLQQAAAAQVWPSSLPADCTKQISCMQQIGAKLRVQKLLVLEAGRLLDTLVLRLTAFDVAQGAKQGTWQEVLREQDEQAVSAALERMVTAFAPPLLEPRPWYTRWWIWTAAGAVLAGAVTAAVVLTQRSGEEVDHTITPPSR